MCNVSNLYMDLAYNRDPWESGLDWGGYVDTRKPFELTPFDLFQTATTDKLGRPFNEAELREGKTELSEYGKGHLLGLQGQLWSEVLNDLETMEYMGFPKILGLAERAWSPPPEWAEIADRDLRFQMLDRSWNRFANNLGQRELPRLSYLQGGVNYRVPLPGALIEDGQLKANVGFPGLSIRYTTDGSEPDSRSSQFNDPIAVGTGEVRLKAFTSSGKSSRTVVVMSQ